MRWTKKVLFAVIAVPFIFNLIFFALDDRQITADEFTVIEGALAFYPPLSLLYLLNSEVVYFFHFLLLILLAYFTYKIGEELFDYRAGFFASFLVLTLHPVITYSRQLMLEFPVTVFFVITIYFLMKSDFFNNKYYSLLYAVSLILLAFTKQTFVLFMMPVFVYSFFRVFLKDPFKKTVAKMNFIICHLFVLFINLPWYATRGINFIKLRYGSLAMSREFDFINFITNSDYYYGIFGILGNYYFLMIQYAIYLILLVLLISVIMSIAKKQNLKKNFVKSEWIILFLGLLIFYDLLFNLLGVYFVQSTPTTSFFISIVLTSAFFLVLNDFKPLLNVKFFRKVSRFYKYPLMVGGFVLIISFGFTAVYFEPRVTDIETLLFENEEILLNYESFQRDQVFPNKHNHMNYGFPIKLDFKIDQIMRLIENNASVLLINPTELLGSHLFILESKDILYNFTVIDIPNLISDNANLTDFDYVITLADTQDFSFGYKWAVSDMVNWVEDSDEFRDNYDLIDVVEIKGRVKVEIFKHK